jgi:hypothetical protein
LLLYWQPIRRYHRKGQRHKESNGKKLSLLELVHDAFVAQRRLGRKAAFHPLVSAVHRYRVRRQKAAKICSAPALKPMRKAAAQF